MNQTDQIDQTDRTDETDETDQTLERYTEALHDAFTILWHRIRSIPIAQTRIA